MLRTIQSLIQRFLLSVWQQLWFNPLPWIGVWGQRLAFQQLVARALSGEIKPLNTLISGLDRSKLVWLRPQIIQFFASDLLDTINDTLWEVWSTQRQGSLEQILLQKNKPATMRSHAWAISLAKLEKEAPLTAAKPAQIKSLAALRKDPDQTVAATSRNALLRLQLQAAIDELFQVWLVSRDEDLWQLAMQAGYQPKTFEPVRAVFLLRSGGANAVRNCPPQLVGGLVAALDDPDPMIAALARSSLPQLQRQSAIDAFCSIWQQKPNDLLTQILCQGGLVASQPVELHLRTALISNRFDLVSHIPPVSVPILFHLLTDNNAMIAKAAYHALTTLADPSAQSALCELAIQGELPLAFSIALQSGYRPNQPGALALFLFLAGLWQEYNTFDFDRRLMQTAFEAASPGLRARITSQVQRSGITDYLSILTGLHLRENIGQLTNEETRMMVELLLQNREWSRCWSIVDKIPLSWSLRVLQSIPTGLWQPEDPSDKDDFVRLHQKALGLPIPTRANWQRALPPAIRIARVKVSGRINHVCFASGQPLIAIGTGNRHLVEWDYHQAKIHRIRTGFNHSIAKVAYTPQGALLCGVRSNTDSPCWIYGWQEEDAFVLPGHQGAVTSLHPLRDGSIISTGRDAAVIHWSLTHRSIITQRGLPNWPRTAMIAHQQDQLALLHSSLSIMSVPNLADRSPASIRTTARSKTHLSMALCGSFSPDDTCLLAGQRNGQVVRYQHKGKNRAMTREAVLQLPSSVVGLAFLPTQNTFVTAISDGALSFHHWPDFSPAGRLSKAKRGLSSLNISPDGAFMATGNQAAEMELWDLRVQQIPEWLDSAMANALPSHLSVIRSLQQAAHLPQDIRRTLEIAQILLERRFRFDIDVDDVLSIQPGEFDIIIA